MRGCECCRRLIHVPVVMFSCLIVLALVARGEDEDASGKEASRVFSGPQKGEALPPFKARGVYDDLAGKDLDFVTEAGKEPLLLVFVHKLTRPSVGLARAVTNYAGDRKEDGLSSAIIWLDDDRSAAEEYLVRARRSLQFRVPVGISLDGAEGPGAYGLNRNLALTVIVGKEGKVTANFALVQPSDTDLPRIVEEIVRAAGGDMPSREELAKYRGVMGERMRGRAARDSRLAALLRKVIQRDLDPEEVDRAAARVDEHVEDDPARSRELGKIARRVVGSEIFAEGGYGTPRAREHLERWAKLHGKKE